MVQTAADVIDQLRLLRCFDTSINQCVGFTFPKFSSDNSENRTCVTKVTVSFINCQFNIRLTPLHISNVKSEIEAAFQGTINFDFMFNPFLCFMRLSPQDIMEIAETFRVDSFKVEQVETRHSMLLKSDDTFWKFIPSTSEYVNFGLFLDDMQEAEAKPKHVVLPSRNVRHKKG